MSDIKTTIKQLEKDLGRSLTDTERRYINWLYDWDMETINTFTGLFKELGAKRK